MTILPTPNRVASLPDLEELPMLEALLEDPRFPKAVQRMADRLNVGRPALKVDVADVTVGLYHFFSIIEGDE